MKKFPIGILATNTEKMWEFARANDMHIHYISSIKREYNTPLETFDKAIHIYEIFMSPETYTALALSVPLVSL